MTLSETHTRYTHMRTREFIGYFKRTSGLFAAATLCAAAAFALQASAQEAVEEAAGEEATATPRQLEARATRMVLNAKDLIESGEEGRGVGMLEAVPRMFPETQARFKAYLELGSYKLNNGQPEEALGVLRLINDAEDEELRAESLLRQAEANRSLKRAGEAVTLLRRLTEDFPASPFANDAYYQIGLIHFEGKRWARAIEAFGMVGTAVPPDEGGGDEAVVFAEAGQRLFVHVSDRDLSVLSQLGESLKVKVTAASGDSEVIDIEVYGRERSDGLASVETVSEPTQPNDGKLTVQGGDEITVEYLDKTDSKGGVNVPVTAKVRVVSSGVVGFMDGAYKQRVHGVFAGQPAFLRLRDLDLDTSPQPDVVTLKVTASYVKPKPTQEEIALGAEAPLTDEDEIIERGSIDVRMVETAPRSGVFKGRFTPVLVDTNNPVQVTSDMILVGPEDKLSVMYTDARHLGGTMPIDRTAMAVVLVGGSTEPQSIVASSSDPDVQSRKLLLEAQLLSKWGAIFKDVGLDSHAAAKSEEGLDKVAEIMRIASQNSLSRSVVEQTYVVKWDLQLLQDQLGAAISTCNALVKLYPDTVYADLALMRIADAKVESNESRDIREGISIYGSVINLPTSSRKAEAQFRIGLALEKTAKMANPANPNFAQAVAAFRRCTEAYPDSSYAGESFKRIINYHIVMKDYARALETLDHVFRDYADSPWLDEMLVQWGIVLFRQGDRAGAAEKFSRVLEEYPGGSAAPTAKALLGRVSGM